MAKRDRNKVVKEVNLAIFSNTPTKYQYDLLQMFYQGAFGSTIGLMEAFNTELDKSELILVGLAEEDGKQVTYPLARLLNPEEVKNYLAPDGKGGYDRDEPST